MNVGFQPNNNIFYINYMYIVHYTLILYTGARCGSDLLLEIVSGINKVTIQSEIKNV